METQSNQIMIYYNRLEGAISARNCLHKATLPSNPDIHIFVEYIEGIPFINTFFLFLILFDIVLN